MSEDGWGEKSLAALLMFLVGFVGFSILGAVILFILISFGFLPAI